MKDQKAMGHERPRQAGNAEPIVSSAAPRAHRLFQPMPDSRFVWVGIKFAWEKLQGWLEGDRWEARVIVLDGKGGVGKRMVL